MILIAIAATDSEPARVVSVESASVAIGRDRRSDVVLQARGVSSHHCRLSPMPGVPGAYMLEDLGSTYGTFVNGTRVGRPVVVSRNDHIVLGEQPIRLTEPGREDEALASLAPAAPQGPPAASSPSAPPPPSSPSAPPSGSPVVPGPRPAASRGSAAPIEAQHTAPQPRGPDHDVPPVQPVGSDWASQHTYFDALAKAWDAHGRPRKGLLRGPDLQRGIGWLRAGRDHRPGPTSLHRDFIATSKKAGRRRVGWALGGFALVAVAATGVAAALNPQVADWLRESVPDPTEPEDETTGEEPPDQPDAAPLDFTELVAQVSGIVDPEDRLLAIGEIAQRAREGFFDPPLDALQRSAHDALARRREVVLSSGGASVTAVTLGPQGRWALSGGDDNEAVLWDLRAPAPGRPLRLHANMAPVSAVGIAPSGRFALTCDEDGVIVRWDLSASDPAAAGKKLEGHDQMIRGLAFDEGGRWGITVDDVGGVAIWDVGPSPRSLTATAKRRGHEDAATVVVANPGGGFFTGGDDTRAYRWQISDDGRPRKNLALDHDTGVTAIAVSPTGRWVVTGEGSGRATLWDLASKRPTKPVAEMTGHTEAISALGISPDGRLLVTASDDDTMRVWELEAKDPSASSVVFAGHTGDITDIEFAAGGTHLISAALDNSLRVWDLTKKDRTVEQYALEGHQDGVLAVDVAPDGLLAVSASKDGTVRAWDILSRQGGRGGRILRGGAEQITDAALDSTGGQLLVTGGAGRVELWDLQDPSRFPVPVRYRGAESLINSGAVGPNGFVAAGAENAKIYYWPIVADSGESKPRVLEGHKSQVTHVAFTPDGSRLVSTSSDRSVIVWPTQTLVPKRLPAVHSDEISAFSMTPNGRYAFTGSLDGVLVRWDLLAEDGAPVKLEQMHDGRRAILALAISPDGRWLASGSEDRRVWIWDVESTQARFRLRDHDEGVGALAFSNNGRWVATGGQDKRIFLWDLESEEPDERVGTFDGHEQSVRSLVFLDGLERLASASNDGTVRLWPLSEGEPMVFTGHGTVVTELVLPRVGGLVSVSYDGSARVWPLAGPQLAARICETLGRPLDDEVHAALFGNTQRRSCAVDQSFR